MISKLVDALSFVLVFGILCLVGAFAFWMLAGMSFKASMLTSVLCGGLGALWAYGETA